MAVLGAAGPNEGRVEGGRATGPSGIGSWMVMVRPSTAPSMPSRSTWPRRKGRAARRRRAGPSHLSHGGGGGAAKDLGVRET